MPTYVLHSDDPSADGARPVREAMLVLQSYLSDQRILESLDLSLAEAYANAARHAYPEGTGPVDVVLEVYPGQEVVLEVADWGVGMPTMPEPDPECCVLPGPASEGGRGIFIINQCCDRVTLHSDGGRHAIRMRLAVPEQFWRPGTLGTDSKKPSL